MALEPLIGNYEWLEARKIAGLDNISTLSKWIYGALDSGIKDRQVDGILVHKVMIFSKDDSVDCSWGLTYRSTVHE